MNEEKCYQGISRINEDNNSNQEKTTEKTEKGQLKKDVYPPFKGKEFFKLFEMIEQQSKLDSFNSFLINYQF